MKRTRILIVEDERLLAEDLRRTLTNLGHEVVGEVHSGADALRVAEQTRPDLILMDIRLEGPMDGVDAARAIRACCDSTVIYLTAHSDLPTLQRALTAEPLGYLIKPVQQRELHATIEMASYRLEMERKLREADRRKDVFLALLAHELRNPLAPIRNAVAVMRQRGMADPRSTAAREVIDEQVTHLTRLIDDLLDVSRLTSGKLVLRTEPIELAAVLRHAVDTSRPLIESAGHTLTVTLPEETITLEADLTRLTQVFANLLNNATKFSAPGGRISISAARTDATVTVQVTDTGIGIPADQLSSVFEPFTQVDLSLEKSRGGLGLGLMLVRQLVSLHGGRVEAHSAGSGQGSTFAVQLPIVSSAAPPQVEAPRVEVERALRILVVDDYRPSADSLAEVLDALGYEVRKAYDGVAACEEAEAWRPDVVLLDVAMPRRSGHDAARHLRAQPWGAGMVIIAVTGMGTVEDARLAREAGCDDHLAKPVQLEELEARLARARAVRRHDCP